MLVGEGGLRAFGVKLAGVPDEPAFLDYLPRDADQKLRDDLQIAQGERRMLLVVGGSAGESRSAAEAARLHVPSHRPLCPRPTSLARLRELPLADLMAAVVWLDDAERYDEREFRDTVERLLRSGMIIGGHIRRSELEARKPKGDVRNPFWRGVDRSRIGDGGGLASHLAAVIRLARNVRQCVVPEPPANTGAACRTEPVTLPPLRFPHRRTTPDH
jgi:hypothetical protein